MNWKKLLSEETVEWLLTGEPWVVHRTQTELLDKVEKDSLVIETKTTIPEHPLTTKIFEGLNKDGYWGNPKDIHIW